MESTTTAADRTGWPPGPWDGEPDRVEWKDEATGLPCLARRNQLGAWCGYVAVPPGHPLHGVGYGALYERDSYPSAHGGLTYSGACQGHICHVPAPGEPDNVWWFGFDCGHAGDEAPGMKRFYSDPDATYRTLAYVRSEVCDLAAQLRAVS